MALGLAAVARFICKAVVERVGEVFALFMFHSWMCMDVCRHLGNETSKNLAIYDSMFSQSADVAAAFEGQFHVGRLDIFP